MRRKGAHRSISGEYSTMMVRLPHGGVSIEADEESLTPSRAKRRGRAEQRHTRSFANDTMNSSSRGASVDVPRRAIWKDGSP